MLRRASRYLGTLMLVFSLGAGLGRLAVPAQAEDDAAPRPVVLIVDSSGSMAAREPDGRAKLDAARETIVEALQGWPSDTTLAIVAYGHRRQGDCADIETIAPMAPLAGVPVKQKLAALRARGKTPLSDALRHGAALLPPEGGALVLLSDGIETCAPDPCAVAAELRAAHANLIIHVVGFGIAADETAQLQCIAEAGAGGYFNAADAGTLATALGDVGDEIAASPEPAIETPAEPPPPPPPVPLQVSLSALALGAPVDAPVRWRILDEAGETAYEGESRALSLPLLPGAYRAEVFAANARGEAAFTVEDSAGAPRAFAVEIEAGRLDLALVANAKSPPFSDLEAQGVAWTLQPLEGQGPVEIAPIAQPSLLLAPGRYRVRAALQGMAAEAVAEVAAGRPQALALDFRLGTIVLEAALDAEGPALDDATVLDWRIGEGDGTQTVEGEARPRLTLPEGAYPIALSIAGAEIADKAAVVAGEERVQRVLVGGGELALSARLGAASAPFEDWRDASWTVEAIAALGVAPGTLAADRLAQAAPTLALAPGRWRIMLTSGVAAAEREVAIAPNAVTPLTVDLGAGRLTMRAAPKEGEPPPVNIVFSVFAVGADGTPATEPIYAAGTSEETSIVVPAGRWRIEALDEQGRQAATELDLAPGSEPVVEMTLQ